MKNKIILIAQARTGSTRLPGKILLKVTGKELLLHFIERLLPSRLVDHIIIATTKKEKDNIIKNLINKNYSKDRVSVFRGSEEDVLDRYYQAALPFDTPETNLIIVRVTSDCPLIDPDMIDAHVQAFLEKNVDYLSSRIKHRTWPHGMEAEIFSFRALEIAWRQAKEKMEREHVTPYIYKTHAKEFKLSELSYKEDLSFLRFTVDYEEDYLFVKKIYEILEPEKKFFNLEDILSLLKKTPSLLEINKERVNPEI